MTKRIYAFIPLLLLACITVPAFNARRAYAHRDGCHRWHSCPSDSGSYVCGDLGYYSECPSSPKLSTTVVTTKTLTNDEPIKFRTVTSYTNDQYRGFKQVTRQGVNGTKRIYTEVTLNDGSEVSRKVVKSEVVVPATDQIVLKGKRAKPEATLSKLTASGKKDKFDIAGTSKPKTEVVLAVNGKRIKRAKSDSKGKFVFKGIKLSGSPKVEIYKRVDGKEAKISESHTLNLRKLSIRSEHN